MQKTGTQSKDKMAAVLTRFPSVVILNVKYIRQSQNRLPSLQKLIRVRGVSSAMISVKHNERIPSHQPSISRYEVSGMRAIFPAKFPTTSKLHTSVTAPAREIVKRAQKMEKSRAKSAELLLKLRRKRLEGLVKPNPVLSLEEKVDKRIERLDSIKRLVIFYWVQVKSKRELTALNKFRILERIVKFISDVQMRDVFLVHEMQQKCFQMLVQDIRANISAFDALQLCKIVVYLAKLSVTDPAVYVDLEKEILKYNLSEYSSRQLSLLSWAFAKPGVGVEHIFQALEKEIFSRELSDFTSAELCSIIWSFAEYGIPDTHHFYRAVGKEILSRDLSQFQPWMLASFCLAYSKVESLSSKVFKVVEEELFQRGELKPFDTNDLVMVVLAFGRTGNLHPKLFRKIEAVLVRRRDFTETVVMEHLEEMYHLLKDRQFRMAEVVKMIELLLYPGKINSIFDVLYRPRRAWKEKVLHQSLFKAY